MIESEIQALNPVYEFYIQKAIKHGDNVLIHSIRKRFSRDIEELTIIRDKASALAYNPPNAAGLKAELEAFKRGVWSQLFKP